MLDPYRKKTVPEAMQASTEVFVRRLYEGYYDFIDLGTCDGGGFEIAKRQTGRRGLGFDLEPHYVQTNIERGRDVACLDVRALSAHEPCVDFAVCSHILEHLPNIYEVGSVLHALRSMCRDYILISGPCFDEEEYLYSKNLKALQSAMVDHTCKFTTIDLVDILHRLRLRNYVIALSDPMLNSDNRWIHRSDEPAEGLWEWDPTKNAPKPKVEFDRKLYRDFVCVVQLRAGVDADAILDRFLWGYDEVVFRSTWPF